MLGIDIAIIEYAIHDTRKKHQMAMVGLHHARDMAYWESKRFLFTPQQKCEYCGTVHQKNRCDSCGAPVK